MLPTTDQYRNCIPEAVSIARSVHRRQKLQQARMQTHSTIAGSRSVREQIELPSILQICCQHVNVLQHDTHIVRQHVIVSHSAGFRRWRLLGDLTAAETSVWIGSVSVCGVVVVVVVAVSAAVHSGMLLPGVTSLLLLHSMPYRPCMH